jgi:hypothetical protein
MVRGILDTTKTYRKNDIKYSFNINFNFFNWMIGLCFHGKPHESTIIAINYITQGFAIFNF